MMKWNWEQEDWPEFKYNRADLALLEQKFLYEAGRACGTLQFLDPEDNKALLVEIMSSEAEKTSEIEGELLNRESLQSSIQKQLGLKAMNIKSSPKERGISNLLVDLYQTFSEPLTHQKLHEWHYMLFQGEADVDDVGRYRTHKDPMQVVSGRLYDPRVYFEAPPSVKLRQEMERFIDWFNESAPDGKRPMPALTRAGIAHLYFVCIHPFEDGNGRIARALAEKVLSQSFEKPTFIALSLVIEKHKKHYYEMLEKSNKNNEITLWLQYFAQVVLDSQEITKNLMEFSVKKMFFYQKAKGMLNERQKKVIARVFFEGFEGFKGGLSAKNYMSITKTSSSTATRDLRDLVEKEFFIQVGELKGARYFLNLQ